MYGLRETDKRLNRLKKLEDSKCSGSQLEGSNIDPDSQENHDTHPCKCTFEVEQGLTLMVALFPRLGEGN